MEIASVKKTAKRETARHFFIVFSPHAIIARNYIGKKSRRNQLPFSCLRVVQSSPELP
jgi:hypothetical protein